MEITIKDQDGHIESIEVQGEYLKLADGRLITLDKRNAWRLIAWLVNNIVHPDW